MQLRNTISSMTALVLVLCSIQGAHAGEGYRERTGFFGGLGFGIAEGNFDLETGNDEADMGEVFEFKLGYAFTDRWGVSVGGGPTVFAYKYEAGFGTLKAEAGSRNFTFSMYEICGWYFLPIYADVWKLFARAGLGGTVVADEFDGEKVEETESVGLVGAGGVEWFLTHHFALTMEVYFRTWGVTLEGMDDKEVMTSGLTFNLMWR